MNLKQTGLDADAADGFEHLQEGRKIDRPNRLITAFVCVLVASLAGCASRAWQAALREDTPAAYHRFMRDYPKSSHITDAQEHLEYHKLSRAPSLAGFDAFVEKYPNSALAAQMRVQLAPIAFDAARAQGTPESYEQFLDQYPDGELAARARGNAAYLAANGFHGDSAALAAFAEEHPTSDFADEARRSAESVALRGRSHFESVGLSIEISPATPEPDRVRRALSERAQEIYGYAGVQLVPVPDVVDASQAQRLPAARLIISHREEQVQTSIEAGTVTRPAIVATTDVMLRYASDGPPIFERRFELRIDPQSHLTGTSVLFSARAPVYWDAFFVPVATWQSRASVRPPAELSASVIDVDAVGDRSIVLYEDGSFQLVELADPARPVVLAQYQRPKDFRKWSGVRILGDRVAVYGEEGIEWVGFDERGPVLVASRGREEIGTVFAIEPVGDSYVIAGARGLMITQANGGELRRIMRRVVKGLATIDDVLVFTDGDSIFISTLDLLREKRVLNQLRLGQTFAPERIRSFGSRAVVMGRGGVLVLDLSDRRKPVVSAKLYPKQIGNITDAAEAGGRIFLLGDRGLQMMNAAATGLTESIDVQARKRLARMGRHLVSVGGQSLQVVDSTPLTAGSLAAAPADSREELAPRRP